MAVHTMTFVFGASSGLIQCRCFNNIALGEPGEPRVSHDKLGGWQLEDDS